MVAGSLEQVLFIALVAFIINVQGQSGILPSSYTTDYYLDRYSDCNGQTREVGQKVVTVWGTSSQAQGQPVTSCTLTLNTENIREPYRFRLQIVTMTINYPNTLLYIYDGDFNGKLLMTFSQTQKKPANLQYLFTSGQRVTFKMTRGENELNNAISIIAEPVRSENIQCNYASEYECNEYGYSYRPLGQKEIAGIIAGCFGFVLIIVILIICCCYRRQRGVNRKWKEEKLGYVNTAASVHSLSGKVSRPVHEKPKGPSSTRAWTTDSSRNGFASIRRSPNLPRAKINRSHRMGSDNSVSDNSDVTIPKQPLPPPRVSLNPRGTSERSGKRYRDRYSDDDRSSFEERSISTKNFSERNYKPPTYREAMRHDSDTSADEHTFVGANDSAQQRVLVEKEMVPRYKTSPEVRRAQRALPPPEKDMEYDSIEPKKFDEKAQLVDKGAGSDEETDQSDTDNESEEESEESSEESEEDDENETAKTDKPDTVYSKPIKQKDEAKATPQKPSEVQPVGFRPPQTSNAQFQRPQYPGNLPPGVVHPQAMYGYPVQGQYPTGVPQYPQGFPPGFSHPSNQPPRQPVPSQPNPYLQANFTVPLNQQQGGPMSFPVQQKSQRNTGPSKTQGQNNTPQNSGAIPVYSYLVSRGYKPVDGRYSPVSNSTGGSNLSGDRNITNEDSDFSATLPSGVELMKRKT